ncbi:hypothetical protein R3P38DRAFT_3189163 [Favolaschia claudopus]|uniref:Uncharacterized protein n=1 Tax=Favolaschia claudopus TaxID=2862362 RepID=A0AAW0BTY3_9AGAR
MSAEVSIFGNFGLCLLRHRLRPKSTESELDTGGGDGHAYHLLSESFILVLSSCGSLMNMPPHNRLSGARIDFLCSEDRGKRLEGLGLRLLATISLDIAGSTATQRTAGFQYTAGRLQNPQAISRRRNDDATSRSALGVSRVTFQDDSRGILLALWQENVLNHLDRSHRRTDYLTRNSPLAPPTSRLHPQARLGTPPSSYAPLRRPRVCMRVHHLQAVSSPSPLGLRITGSSSDPHLFSSPPRPLRYRLPLTDTSFATPLYSVHARTTLPTLAPQRHHSHLVVPLPQLLLRRLPGNSSKRGVKGTAGTGGTNAEGGAR